MYAIAFFAALRIGEITCQPKQTNRNLIFLNQASLMKRNGDSIDKIKLTLRHYKHSNTAEPVNIFIYVPLVHGDLTPFYGTFLHLL